MLITAQQSNFTTEHNVLFPPESCIGQCFIGFPMSSEFVLSVLNIADFAPYVNHICDSAAVFWIRFLRFGLGLYMNSLEISSEYRNPSFSSLLRSVRAVCRTTLYARQWAVTSVAVSERFDKTKNLLCAGWCLLNPRRQTLRACLNTLQAFGAVAEPHSET